MRTARYSHSRALGLLLPAILICHAADSRAAAVASGRNWRISIERMQCEAAGSVLVIGTRVHYLGPKGPVEAPVSELVDAEGRQIRPRSMIWKDGSKQLAQWLPSGGLANVQVEFIGEVQLKFDVRGTTGELKLVFGDIRAFPLTRKSASTAKWCLREPAETRRRSGAADVASSAD